MQWIRSHRYTVALIAAAVLVIVGGVMAKNASSEIPTGRGDVKNVSVEYPYYAPSTSEFNGAATIVQENPQSSEQNGSSLTPLVSFFGNKASLKEIPAVQTALPEPRVIPKIAEGEPVKTQSPPPNYDYASFFQALSRILSPIDTRTAEQKALFAYGNEVGSLITTFENTHMGVVQTLKTFFDSRIDPSKAAGIPKIAGAYAQLTTASSGTNLSVSSAVAAANLQKVADDYAQLGAAIGNIRGVPPQAESANAKLASGYADVAKGLSQLSQAETDSQLLEAINAYNANADDFIKNYVALVHLFSAYGVKFSASDAGAIFSFSSAGSL